MDDRADVLYDLVVAAVQREVQLFYLLVDVSDAAHQVRDAEVELLLLLLRAEHVGCLGLLVSHVSFFAHGRDFGCDILLLVRVDLQILVNLLIDGCLGPSLTRGRRLEHHLVDVTHLLRLVAIEHLLVGAAVPHVWVAGIRTSQHEDHVSRLQLRVTVRVRHDVVESLVVVLFLLAVLVGGDASRS